MNMNVVLGILWSLCAFLNTLNLAKYVMAEQFGMVALYLVCVGLDTFLAYGYFKKAQ